VLAPLSVWRVRALCLELMQGQPSGLIWLSVTYQEASSRFHTSGSQPRAILMRWTILKPRSPAAQPGRAGERPNVTA
jgi:hypothetical protein